MLDSMSQTSNWCHHFVNEAIIYPIILTLSVGYREKKVPQRPTTWKYHQLGGKILL